MLSNANVTSVKIEIFGKGYKTLSAFDRYIVVVSENRLKSWGIFAVKKIMFQLHFIILR